jgi:hypothetical protein
VIEWGSNASGYVVGALSDSLGLPFPITMLLAGGAAGNFSRVGVKHAFSDTESILRVLRGGDELAAGRGGLEDGLDGVDIRQMDLVDGVGNPIGSGGAINAVEGAGKANPNGVKVAQGQQDKHIPGTNNYNQSVASGANRGILTENAQQLLDDFAGTGSSLGNNREWVDFGKPIGQYYDINTGTYLDTTKGIIHYNNSGGAHIVPSNPTGTR